MHKLDDHTYLFIINLKFGICKVINIVNQVKSSLIRLSD